MPPGYIKVFKTAKFKIHNPSLRKRAMLFDAMKRAHLAYDKLLQQCLPDEGTATEIRALPKPERREHFRRMEQRVVKLSEGAGKHPQLNGNAKSAIRVDCLAQIKSTINLGDEQDDVGRPVVALLNDSEEEFDASLDELIHSLDLPSENMARDKLLRASKPGQLRPLGFVRSNKSAGFLLLKNMETGRLCAWLALHPKSSRRARPVNVRDMANLKDGEIMSFRSNVGDIFPLEFGRSFHEHRYLEKGEPQTARLCKKGDDYELHVAFKFVVKKREARTWLGVDRGIYNLAAFSVITQSGIVVDEARISGMELRYIQRQVEARIAKGQKKGKVVRDRTRWAQAEIAVHLTANAIVEMADKHDAQVVLEDLKNIGAGKKRTPGSRRGGFRKLFGRAQYEKLRRVVEYKLLERGLPKPVKVDPKGTSIQCPECGHWSPKNREKRPEGDQFKMDVFACVECKHRKDADENAARVIAMKRVWMDGVPSSAWKKRKKKPLPDKHKFEVFLRGAAERRMAG